MARTRRAKIARRIAVRGAALAVVATLAISALIGGRAYVWCAPMAEARAHCCCPSAPVDHDAIRVACCDDRISPTLPSAERSAGAMPAIPPPIALAVIAIVLAPSEPNAAIREHDGREARAGPGDRVHARASVYLI